LGHKWSSAWGPGPFIWAWFETTYGGCDIKGHAMVVGQATSNSKNSYFGWKPSRWSRIVLLVLSGTDHLPSNIFYVKIGEDIQENIVTIGKAGLKFISNPLRQHLPQRAPGIDDQPTILRSERYIVPHNESPAKVIEYCTMLWAWNGLIIKATEGLFKMSGVSGIYLFHKQSRTPVTSVHKVELGDTIEIGTVRVRVERITLDMEGSGMVWKLVCK